MDNCEDNKKLLDDAFLTTEEKVEQLEKYIDQMKEEIKQLKKMSKQREKLEKLEHEKKEIINKTFKSHKKHH